LQNPTNVPYLNQDGTLRVGDAVSRIVGIVDYSNQSYRIQPVKLPLISITNKRPSTVPDVGGTIKVATFNLSNYFNGDGVGGGFPTSRGADTPDEFAQQSAKIVYTLALLDADIVGLIEIENDDGPRSAIADLVSQLNQLVGVGSYDYIYTGTLGEDETRVALIYQPASIVPIGNHQILDSSVDELFNDDYNQPALAQSFQSSNTDNGSADNIVTIVVSHLKSKDSDCDDVNDIDRADGQGNCSVTRTNTAISQAGYMDLLQEFLGVSAYTNVSAGQTGYLNHALADESLLPKITGVADWHINADEPRAMDYNDSNQAGLYKPDMFRFSEHDPIIVGIDMRMIDNPGDPVNSTYFLPIVLLPNDGVE